MDTGQQRRSFVLQREPAEAGRARREVARACSGLGQDTVATAQLLACELFTNALDHGAGDITVEVTRQPGELRVDVVDAGPDRPRVRTFSVNEVRGRGLMILEALAARWGTEPCPHGPGKSVWFVLRTSQ